jgi:hypothetical protein
LRRVFNKVTPAASTRCEYCMPFENLRPIYVCQDPKMTLEEAWPRFKWFQ